MDSAHLSGSTFPGLMSGISGAPSLQQVPKSSGGGRPEAMAARAEVQFDRKIQEGQSSLCRSESSELSSLLSQDGDFLTGRSSDSPSDHPEIKLKVTQSQQRYSSSRVFLPSPGGDALNDPDESLDEPGDSASEFELEEDEDLVGRDMRSSASRPRPSRTVADVQAIQARGARRTRRASMPRGTSRVASNKYTGAQDLGDQGKRNHQGGIAQLGEKFHGGTVTKRGKGWIVIEESSGEDVPASSSRSDTAAPSVVHLSSPSPRAGKKRKRKSSAPHAYEPHAPASIPEAQPPPAKKVAWPSEENALDIGELRRSVIRRLSESLSESV